jgi:hypothetical protein
MNTSEVQEYEACIHRLPVNRCYYTYPSSCERLRITTSVEDVNSLYYTFHHTCIVNERPVSDAGIHIQLKKGEKDMIHFNGAASRL